MPRPYPTPLPFAEAIEAMRRRGVVLPETYYGALQGLARAQAFSVAGLAGIDQIQGVLDSLTDDLAQGNSFRDWQKRVKAGEVPLDLPRHRLDNIFRTNIQGAYNRGRCEQQQRNRESRPYLMYDAVNDRRTRPAHAAMDGHVAPIDDPIWQSWYPPNGHRCRCRVISLTEKEALARGVPPRPPDAAPDSGWDYAPCEEPNRGIQQAIDRRAFSFRDKPLHQPLIPALQMLWVALVAWTMLGDTEE